MFKRLLDLIKNPTHEKPFNTGEIQVSHEVETLQDVLDKTEGEGLIIGRTTDNNIALSVPGYALITMFMLAFRHGPTICGMINSMGYHVKNILGEGPPKNAIEHGALMVFDIFKEQGHGVMQAFPFVRDNDADTDDLVTRYNAIMEPAQFIELASSISELNMERPTFDNAELNEYVNEVVQWLKTGMEECITPVDVMSSMGGKLEGNA